MHENDADDSALLSATMALYEEELAIPLLGRSGKDSSCLRKF